MLRVTLAVQRGRAAIDHTARTCRLPRCSRLSGHLDRRTSDTDRRVQVIRLTKAGRAEFRKMAAEHELWIADIFSDLNPKDVRELMRLLAKTKASAQKSAQARAL